MTGLASKKVRILRFEREPAHGFLPVPGFASPEGIDLLTPEGQLVRIPYTDIRVVCFVQEFHEPLPKLDGARFASRPKMAGLWTRMRFRDGMWMDGLLANNLLQGDGYGFTLTPPDPGLNPTRIWVPRTALSEFHVLAVVGSELSPGRKKATPGEEQRRLF